MQNLTKSFRHGSVHDPNGMGETGGIATQTITSEDAISACDVEAGAQRHDVFAVPGGETDGGRSAETAGPIRQMGKGDAHSTSQIGTERRPEPTVISDTAKSGNGSTECELRAASHVARANHQPG